MARSYPAVVRVFATTQEPDYDCPWQARTPSSGTGSGVVIGDQQILTGAHVVANSTFLQVQKLSHPDKAVAHVEAVCHDCDLALLRVEDPGFTNDVPHAEIGTLPELRDKVSVVGFPIGGEEVSVTEGVVSRIEVQRYSHSQRNMLAVTVDAAINRGNSGGPVFKKGRVAGIAFQKLTDADNIGEMVPAPIINQFLAGHAQGKPAVVPGLGIATQNLENPLLRQQVGLNPDESGVLIVSIEYGSSACGILQPGDALLEIDGSKIASNGTVQYRDRFRTRYDVTIGHKFVGDSLELLVLRDGTRKPVTVELKPLRYLVPRAQYDIAPTYFVYAGLVFQRLTRDFLATWDTWWNKAPKEFLYHYFAGVRAKDRQEIVILTQILGDKINVGYAHLYNESLISVNGVKPRDMAHFAELVDGASGIIEFRTSSQGRAVFQTAEVSEANRRILARYHIGRDRSDNLAPKA